MATTQEAIRRLSIQATETGVDEVTGKLEKLAGAQQDVAVASSTTEKTTLSLETRFASIERRYVTQVRAQQEYEKVQRQINAAVAQNPALQERANVVLQAAKERFDSLTGGANDNAKAVGLARYELINLSRQAQDVAVSLAGGQSPMTVLFQQGSQIADVFTSSRGTLAGFFQQTTTWLGGFLTAGRIAFGGVTALVIGATLALNSYLDKQRQVQMSLTGAGRASGATVGSINAAAQSGSSLTGLSVSDARELASALAATGKVANDNIPQIVRMGHDVTVAFGSDAKGAVDLLTKAFTDPVKGAEDLNARLGFLDASMQNQIRNLVAQNRLWDAQRILAGAAASSLAEVNAQIGTSTRFWTALGNVASNAWDRIGAALSRATGIGFKAGLDEQMKAALDRLAELQKIAAARSPAVNVGLGTTALIEQQRTKIAELTAEMQRYSQATADAQARQRSFAQDAAARQVLPEVGQLETLQNQAVLLQGAVDDTRKAIANLVPDEASGERLKALTAALEMFQRALNVTQTSIRDFKPAFEANLQTMKTANDAMTAFSPAAKAEIARRESIQSTAQSSYTDDQRKALAEQAYANALKQSNVALSEQARSRRLTAEQSVQSAQLEIDLIGKTIGQQTEMRANLQARQQLEQQASQNRTAFDQAEFERLQKINAELGRKAQLAAQASVNDNINFGRQTAFLLPEDAQIAQQLKGQFSDVAAALGSSQAEALRFNNTLQGIASTAQDVNRGLWTDFLSGIRNGATYWDAFRSAAVNALGKISDKLIQMSADRLWASAFGGSSSGLGGLLGSLFGSSSAALPAGSYGVVGAAGSMVVPTFHGGANSVGLDLGVQRSVDPSVFAAAPRFHLGVDEVPAILQRGEKVIPRGQNDNSPQPMVINYSPTIDARGADAASVARLAATMAKDRKDFERNVIGVMTKHRINTPGSNR